VEASDARATVVRYSQLYQAVLELSRKHRLAPAAAALLAQTLASSQGRDGAAVRRGALTSAS
jgi:redox-regulated HSP33 family molecular chaperone